MFRVPNDPDVPTFDQTFKVGFFRWLTSSAADRREWTTRRMTATRLAARNAKAARDAKYQPQIAELRAQAAEVRAQIVEQLRARRR